MPYSAPVGPPTVFTDRFWDDRERWEPPGVGVVPGSLRPYFGPLPSSILQPLRGTDEQWAQGVSYAVYAAGGYHSLNGCATLIQPDKIVRIRQVQNATLRPFYGPVLALVSQVQSISFRPVINPLIDQGQGVSAPGGLYVRIDQVQTVSAALPLFLDIDQVQTVSAVLPLVLSIDQVQTVSAESRHSFDIDQVQDVTVIGALAAASDQVQNVFQLTIPITPIDQVQDVTQGGIPTACTVVPALPNLIATVSSLGTCSVFDGDYPITFNPVDVAWEFAIIVGGVLVQFVFQCGTPTPGFWNLEVAAVSGLGFYQTNLGVLVTDSPIMVTFPSYGPGYAFCPLGTFTVTVHT